jgi:hypothetical protein
MIETEKIQQNTSSEEVKIKRRGMPQNLTNAGKGRKPGTKNKLTKSAHETIQKAFDGMGGAKSLIDWAEKNDRNRGAFYTLIWTRIIPKSIDLKADITHDIASRLLQARNRAKELESRKELEFNHQGMLIESSEETVKSIVEEIENEEEPNG